MMAALAIFVASLLDIVMWLIAFLGCKVCTSKRQAVFVLLAMLVTREAIAALTTVTYRFPATHAIQVIAYLTMIVVAYPLTHLKQR